MADEEWEEGGDAATEAFEQVRVAVEQQRGELALIRVIEGRLKLTCLDPASEVILTPDRPGLVLPEQPHFVEPLGAMRMQVDFYDQRPSL
ncbi:DUF1971 domain-containing protein [Sphingomonas sp.]|uniref:DUF1971 domain-containing protein n=1 Tax=Sphingomonas sp. TaxID=28214 RepID=UPI00289AEEF0|nr:DUF1971 domain-containing protein [Sphingomonas sp.]